MAVYVSVNFIAFILEISHNTAAQAPLVCAYSLTILGVIMVVIDLIMIYWFVTSFGRFIILLFPKSKSKSKGKKCFLLLYTFFISLILFSKTAYKNVYSKIVNLWFAYEVPLPVTLGDIINSLNHEAEWLRTIESMFMIQQNVIPVLIGISVLIIFYNFGTSSDPFDSASMYDDGSQQHAAPSELASSITYRQSLISQLNKQQKQTSSLPQERFLSTNRISNQHSHKMQNNNFNFPSFAEHQLSPTSYVDFKSQR